MSSLNELEEMIRHLQTRIVFLEGRVAQLEAGRNPAYPNNPNPWPAPVYQKPKCSKCGMVLENVMGYVCGAVDCPTFPRITCTVVSGGGSAVSSKPEEKIGKLQDGLGVGMNFDLSYNPTVEKRKVNNPGWSDYEPARHGEYYDGKWYPDRGR